MRVQENFEHFATEGLSCEEMSLSTEQQPYLEPVKAETIIYVFSRIK